MPPLNGIRLAGRTHPNSETVDGRPAVPLDEAKHWSEGGGTTRTRELLHPLSAVSVGSSCSMSRQGCGQALFGQLGNIPVGEPPGAQTQQERRTMPYSKGEAEYGERKVAVRALRARRGPRERETAGKAS